MLAHPETEWYIACATAKFGSGARTLQYDAAIDSLRKRGVIISDYYALGLNDGGSVLHADEFMLWHKTVARDLRKVTRLDAVFTHNRLGEYGHGHHMALNSIARSTWRDKPVWSFYVPASHVEQERLPIMMDVDLTGGLDIVKRAIMVEAYPDQLEAVSAHQPGLMLEQFSYAERFTTTV